MITVGVLGATGYMGGEVIRVLLDHPQVRIEWVTSRSGHDLAEHHPNLFGVKLNVIHPDHITPCDVVFLALPTQASIDAAQKLLAQGCKVIDLGAAFRLKDRAQWERVYGMNHPRWDLAQRAVYGVTELHADEVQATNLIANPGCYASAAILAYAPLVQHDWIDTKHLMVTGLSGTAGAGAELSRAAHHPEIGNNLVPYNVVDHRHSYEMEQELSNLCNTQVSVHFTPAYVPIVRGILNICSAFTKRAVSRADVVDLYKEYYRDQPFIKIYDLPKEQQASWQYKPYPWVNAVAGTNYCYIGMDVDELRGRIVIFSVLDSIGKGGAQVGIENMNLLFGLERTMGLTRRGMHPV